MCAVAILAQGPVALQFLPPCPPKLGTRRRRACALGTLDLIWVVVFVTERVDPSTSSHCENRPQGFAE
eukprot:13297110-Heterocapsa_arctica.AAC.1